MEINHKEYARWRWLWGRPADFWISHGEFVEKFIIENKLEPIKKEHFPMEAMEKRVIVMKDIINPWGGRKFAHLHSKGEFYPLKEEQWKLFSEKVLEGFTDKLANAKTINFEQLIALSDAMETIREIR